MARYHCRACGERWRGKDFTACPKCGTFLPQRRGPGTIATVAVLLAVMCLALLRFGTKHGWLGEDGASVIGMVVLALICAVTIYSFTGKVPR